MITQNIDDRPRILTVAVGGAAMHNAANVIAAKFGPLSRGDTHPREARLIRALLQGPLMREEVDRIAGVSNGPDLVMNVRNSIGLKIDCERLSFIDRDGRRCRPGRYSLEPQSRETAMRWLGGWDAERERTAGDRAA